ncbi:unnamed protein product [Closterium sp. NIES-65]|nr:unnamed protein product [Closterium sp. NIES-65]
MSLSSRFMGGERGGSGSEGEGRGSDGEEGGRSMGEGRGGKARGGGGGNEGMIVDEGFVMVERGAGRLGGVREEWGEEREAEQAGGFEEGAAGAGGGVVGSGEGRDMEIEVEATPMEEDYSEDKQAAPTTPPPPTAAAEAAAAAVAAGATAAGAVRAGWVNLTWQQKRMGIATGNWGGSSSPPVTSVMASYSSPSSSSASKDVLPDGDTPPKRFTKDGVEKKPQNPKHNIYRHFWTFDDPTKKGKQCECLWCGKEFAFSSSRCTQHLAEWNDENVRRDGGIVCAKVPKRVSASIRDEKEIKITARKDKERATDAALNAVSGGGGAGPKPKKGRMEDWYGEGGKTATCVADEAICLYIAGTRTAERQCEHPLFLNMLRAVAAAGSSYVPPKRDYVGGVGLQQCKRRIEKGLEPITKTWRETGVTIANDMMRDKSGRAQMNILCINDSGAVFQEAIDCKAETKSGAFIVSILQPIIEKIGPQHVVAVCTDGGSNYVSASKKLQKIYPHLEFIPCATHVLDLLMEDIGGMDWAQDVVPVACDIISFVRSHTWMRAFLRCPELHGKEKSLQPLRPAGTRFGTNYIAVSRLLKIRSHLAQMVTHKEWEEKGGSAQTGKTFTKSVLDVEWWKKAETFVRVMELPYKVMRRTDGEAKGRMGELYDIMMQLTEDLLELLEKDDCGLKDEDKEGVKEHMRRRWDESLACPLHVVGRILNPANQEEGIYHKDVECTRVMKAWLQRLRAFVDKYWKSSGDTKGTMKGPQEGKGCFGSEEAIEGRAEIKAGKGDMVTWWKVNGWEYRDLAGLACRALSQPVSASACERGWSTWDGVHTARRNRLGSEKVRDLVFVAYNWNAVHNHHKGAAGAGPSGEVRKAGIVEGNIPPAPLPEGYQLEEDGEVEVDEDDITFDEYKEQEDMEKEEEKEMESEEVEDE